MLVTTSRACLGHDPGLPEQIARLDAVLRRLETDGRFLPIESAPAGRAALRLRHPDAYIDMLERQATDGLPAGEEVPLGPGSWPAILGAVGAAVAAVDHVLTSGGHAFAAVRPPGHHASATTAMGFCPVNTVAIATAHARSHGVERVLIVDWDVHHGNGTQEIVAEEVNTRFVSMHQSPWYPGTGMADERGVGNLFNLPMAPGLPRAVYREALWRAIEAAGEGWSPDLVLLSAGYDSLAGDPLGGFSLEPEDDATWVDRLRQRWPDVPVVGVMEGGYLPDRLADGVLATVEALAR
jgi:acetoin utilization deacetylase AcuC-like enzyme